MDKSDHSPCEIATGTLPNMHLGREPAMILGSEVPLLYMGPAEGELRHARDETAPPHLSAGSKR
eukprot:7566752-Pyramimonas_sp.AAC.1